MGKNLTERAGLFSRCLTEEIITHGLLCTLPAGSLLFTHLPHKLNRILSRRDVCQRVLRMLTRLPLDIRLHSSRVATLAGQTAQMMSLDSATVRRIYLAGMLHDVGKVWVKKEVLTKPGPLTLEEYEHMKEHVPLGANCVQIYLSLPCVAKVILHHHERIDGKGYPFGLSREKIPLESRVIAVADAYDAMIGGPGGSSRRYRPRRTQKEALEELMASAGQQFDAEVVRTFCALIGTRRVHKTRSVSSTGLV